MKKFTLLVAGLFIGSLAFASETTIFSDRPTNYAIDYREAEPIVFMERGIEFLVFPDGAFDFNTEPSSRTADTYHRYGRGRYNETSGAPGRGVKVEHDQMGRVRRVGNVFINYDAKGRVKRIGTIYMTYNRVALIQIGNLRLIYDRSGRIIDVAGYINASNRDYVYEACGESHYGGGDHNQGGNNGSTYSDDDDRVYYRKPAQNTRG